MFCTPDQIYYPLHESVNPVNVVRSEHIGQQSSELGYRQCNNMQISTKGMS